MAAGKYDLKVIATGFTDFENAGVDVAAGQVNKLDVKLAIQTQEEKVVVTDQAAAALSVDPAANAGAIVIQGRDLEALSDDPDELQSDLQALAGPSAGPNGGQIYIDGFTAGTLPPKASIREIRINQNPFSSEYDKLGYGRIEILTKPGTDQWHGQLYMSGTTSSLQFTESSGEFARRRRTARIRIDAVQRKHRWAAEQESVDVLQLRAAEHQQPQRCERARL